MSWNIVRTKIEQNIVAGVDLDPMRKYKIVTKGPDYLCMQRNFGGSPGYSVKIGNNTTIDVPFTMLQTIYEDALSTNNRVYNTNLFKKHFPKEREIHTCYPQTIGKIFLLSGIAEQIDSKNYLIK